MSKHTPGPWINDHSHGSKNIYANSEGVITYVANAIEHDVDDFEEVLANAQLIATAPEMLEALRLAKPYLEGINVAKDRLEKINKAIAKAEGNHE